MHSSGTTQAVIVSLTSDVAAKEVVAALRAALDPDAEKAGRNARDGYTTEHMEIAAYELLKRVAEHADDMETVTACNEIIAEERAMAATIEQNWDKLAALSLREEGIAA